MNIRSLPTLLLLLLVAGQGELFGAVVQYNYTATLAYVDNAQGVQQSTPLHTNDIITGSFSFDPTLFSDGSPNDPAQGNYFHPGPSPVPASFSLSIDGFGIHSQPNSGFFFDITTPAETQVARDAFILQINSNLVLTGGWTSNVSPFLNFVLENSTGNVITSKQFTQLPQLNKAEFPFAYFYLQFQANPATLTFPNGSVSSSALFLEANITSITLVPEPPTVVMCGIALLGAALIAFRRWRFVCRFRPPKLDV